MTVYYPPVAEYRTAPQRPRSALFAESLAASRTGPADPPKNRVVQPYQHNQAAFASAACQ